MSHPYSSVPDTSARKPTDKDLDSGAPQPRGEPALTNAAQPAGSPNLTVLKDMPK